MNLNNEITGTIIDFFSNIEDPRAKRGVRYKLSDLLLLVLYASLCGETDAVDIEYYVELNIDYFKDLISLKSIPSHDTFSRLLNMVNFEQLMNNLTSFLESNYPHVYQKYNDMKVLHIDGKAVRAANAKSEGQKTVYLLNAMFEGSTIELNSNKIENKENELTNIPDFLDNFYIENTIVTIDAIGCTQNILNKILEKKGCFLVPVKKNQGNLHSLITNELLKLEEKNNDGKCLFDDLDGTELIRKGHGRIEKYSLKLLSDTRFLVGQFDKGSVFNEIGSIGIIDKITTTKKSGKEIVIKHRYICITNLEDISANNMLEIKLSHWNIESQHWILDMILREDYCTARKGYATLNASCIKKFVLKLRNEIERFKKIPVNRFLKYNIQNIEYITELLFNNKTL